MSSTLRLAQLSVDQTAMGLIGSRRAAQQTPDAADQFFALPDQGLNIVLRDPVTRREIALGVVASLRDLEVLGSAGRYYADAYTNPERTEQQVRDRQARARRVGQALWEAAVERCDIESA